MRAAEPAAGGTPPGLPRSGPGAGVCDAGLCREGLRDPSPLPPACPGVFAHLGPGGGGAALPPALAGPHRTGRPLEMSFTGVVSAVRDFGPHRIPDPKTRHGELRWFLPLCVCYRSDLINIVFSWGRSRLLLGSQSEMEPTLQAGKPPKQRALSASAGAKSGPESVGTKG